MLKIQNGQSEKMERCRARASSFNNNLSPRFSQPHLPPKPLSLTRRSDDAELSVFDAERYFSEGDKFPPKTIINRNGISQSYGSSTNPRDSPVSSLDGYRHNGANRSFRASPTASSKASWNSQSCLLWNPPGCVAVSARDLPSNEKRRHGSNSSLTAGRRFFRRNCSCSGKKSVDVEGKYAAEPKSPVPVRIRSDKVTRVTCAGVDAKETEVVSKLKISAGTWATESAIFSPQKPLPAEIVHRIVNSGGPRFSFNMLAPPPAAAAASGADDPPRESLETFQLSEEVMNLRRSAGFHDRQAAMVPACDDDVASDTSSDLFEIASFSTNSAYNSRRDWIDEFLKLGKSKAAEAAGGIHQFRRTLEETAASIAPSECYAPSEVSVEWSVTTADGGFDRASIANFSSAASEYDEVRFVQTKNERFGLAKMAGNGERKKKMLRTGFSVRRGLPFALEKSELTRLHSVHANRPIQTT